MITTQDMRANPICVIPMDLMGTSREPSNVYRTEWVTQKALAVMFSLQLPTIATHLKIILVSGDPNREAVISKMEITQPDQAILTTQEAA